ncbi:CrcB protein [Salsuginibacillus halophilus]|uniref:Fluoride-specific ion channel FluC n=1 Tax=Salsuginibacillus halophilus TaxID=517424 RepID=A0A2P8HDT6_9BACI|nr:fluoride efflux transporter CrcB [Salsuginibacillus halophilus]PSL44400.1 CrcB protein [Salsuginibacillus halophilus]
MNLILLLVGGALGGVARYLAGRWIGDRTWHAPFPLPMLLVNLAGAFGLGLFLGGMYEGVPLGAYEDPLFLFVVIGFFGAFTTYSTFSVESVKLLEEKKYGALASYVLLSMAGSLLLFGIGFVLLL